MLKVNSSKKHGGIEGHGFGTVVCDGDEGSKDGSGELCCWVLLLR